MHVLLLPGKVQYKRSTFQKKFLKLLNLSSIKQIWVTENSKLILEKTGKVIADLLSMLNGIFEFAFKGGKEKHIDFSRNKAFSVIKKRIHIFTGNSLQSEVRYPIKRYYFEVGNLNML